MSSIAFKIGNFGVHWYGIFYLITFLLAYVFLIYLSKKKFLPLKKSFYDFLDKHLDDFFIFVFLGVVLGGRLGHCLFYDFSYCFGSLESLKNIPKIWQGGMSFVGGILGVLISLLSMKKIYKLGWQDLLILSDLIVIFASIGIFLGRIGNFLNQELVGIPVPSDFRGMGPVLVNFLKSINLFYVYSSVDNILRLNYNFLASFFEGFVIFWILIYFFLKQLKLSAWKIGLQTGLFLFFYGFFRFFLEYAKNKAYFEFIGPLIKSQYFFVIFMIVGFFLIKRALSPDLKGL